MWKHKGAIYLQEIASQISEHVAGSEHTFKFENIRMVTVDRSKGGQSLV